MRILITAGPTRQPIDAVRCLSNRSSGRMGLALVQAARAQGHEVTLVAGPTAMQWPSDVRRIDVETTAQMHAAVASEFPSHALLIMAAAVADFTPVSPLTGKIARGQPITLELQPTEDILASIGLTKRPDQRTVGFSLTPVEELPRAIEKLNRKHLDLIAWNGPATLDSDTVAAKLFWPDGHHESLGSRSKGQFADNLLQRALELFPAPG